MGSIYITGGIHSQNTYGNVVRFDLASNAFIQDVPFMSMNRHYHSSCVTKDIKLFVFGGKNGFYYLNSIEVLDLKLNKQWTQIVLDDSFSSRALPSVFQIDPTTVLIMGGGFEKILN